MRQISTFILGRKFRLSKSEYFPFSVTQNNHIIITLKISVNWRKDYTRDCGV